MGKKRKLRADFRKNHDVRTRQNDVTQRFAQDSAAAEDEATAERITGKGGLTRRRTLVGGELTQDASGAVILPGVDPSVCSLGRVLRVQGLVSTVALPDGRLLACATRRLLKQLSTGLRHVVAAGDNVWVRPEGQGEGIIERVEPRHGVLSRASKRRQHLIAANVDQLLIVTSAAEPRIKPGLVDRYLATCERGGLKPLICINKVDLVDAADLMPLVGVYAQLGYEVRLCSAVTGEGISGLRDWMSGRVTALTGQSGVGKSSLLNAVQPGLGLRVQTVSAETEKGRHTTTTAELFPAPGGGYLIDTPGIRQFQLWDIAPQEVASLMPDLRPYVSQCRFPDCTHTHEDACAVKDAVADGWIDTRRYESYVHLHAGDAP